MLGHEISFTNVQKFEILWSMFSNNDGIKFKVSNNKDI